MKNRTLSSKDIRQIIKACSDHGVLELEFEGLSLKLYRPEKALSVSAPTAAIPDESVFQEQVSDEQRQLSFLNEEKDDVALMVIESPFEMERRIAEGELIDEGAEH